jgi:hypothetical protein
MLDFYAVDKCDFAATPVFTQTVSTVKTTMDNLSKSFSYDSQANNIKSVRLSLGNEAPAGSFTPTKGCFDDVFFK